MYLRRLLSIDDFDYFQEWQDSENRHPHSFGRHTVIFGPNATGKSTLGKICAAVETRQHTPDSLDTRLRRIKVEITDGKQVIERSLDSVDVPQIVVFNQDYVARNLEPAFRSSDELGSPLYVIGEVSVDLARQLESNEKKLTELKEQLPKLIKEASDADKHWEKQVVGKIKKDVNERLTSFNEKYGKYRYNKNDVQELMQGPKQELDHEQIKKAEADLNIKADTIPTDRQLPSFPDFESLSRKLDALAEFNVKAKTIERLKQNVELADWAQQGLELHEPGDRCGFCNEPVRQDRIDALHAHFDKSLRELQAQIDSLELAVDAAGELLATAVEELDEQGGDEGKLAEAIRKREGEISEYASQGQAFLVAGRDLLRARREDPFSSAEWNAPKIPDDQLHSELADSAKAENENLARLRANIGSIRTEASKRMLRHIAAKHASEYQSADSATKNAKKEMLDAKKSINDLEDLIKRHKGELAQEQLDGHKLANELTADLQIYFGHTQLSIEFIPSEDQPGFRILRNSRNAERLSEGERGAISLLYFLRDLESENVKDLARTCVVIDDPVSSFDQDAMLAAFSFIHRRLEPTGGELRCAQLVLLTHNFEFFRLWSNALAKRLDKDLGDARRAKCEVQALLHRRAALLEIRATVDGSDPSRRTSVLRGLGNFGTAASEYFHLFRYVCESTHPDKEEWALVVGNAARRLMESFVRWKLPQTDDLTGAVEQLGRKFEVSPEITEQVVNALHASSHRTEIEITNARHVGRIVGNVRAMLIFMNTVDRDHFNGMKKAMDIEPQLA